MSIAPASFGWFVRHELNLAWREWIAMMTGGRRARGIGLAVFLDGPPWLAAYGVLAGLGALSTAIALTITMALFRFVGPKRTRLIAQIVAALVGAGFVIGVQAAAILHYGNMSRFALFQSADVVASAPALGSRSGSPPKPPWAIGLPSRWYW